MALLSDSGALGPLEATTSAFQAIHGGWKSLYGGHCDPEQDRIIAAT
jgi:hypothetical protein